MLTCFYLSLLILGGGYIAITFLVGEVVGFRAAVGRPIEGVSDGMAESLSSLGDALEGLLRAESMAGVPGRTDT